MCISHLLSITVITIVRIIIGATFSPTIEHGEVVPLAAGKIITTANTWENDSEKEKASSGKTYPLNVKAHIEEDRIAFSPLKT